MRLPSGMARPGERDGPGGEVRAGTPGLTVPSRRRPRACATPPTAPARAGPPTANDPPGRRGQRNEHRVIEEAEQQPPPPAQADCRRRGSAGPYAPGWQCPWQPVHEVATCEFTEDQHSRGQRNHRQGHDTLGHAPCHPRAPHASRVPPPPRSALSPPRPRSGSAGRLVKVSKKSHRTRCQELSVVVSTGAHGT